MSTAFQFEDPGEGISEAEVIRVLVSEGDEVSEGQDVMVVETDKAAFELASPRSGTIEQVVVQEGDRIEVGDTLLRYSEAEQSRNGRGEEASRSRREARAAPRQEQAAAKGEAGKEAKGEPAEDEPRREKAQEYQGKHANQDKQDKQGNGAPPAGDAHDAETRSAEAEPQEGRSREGQKRRGRGGREVVMATPATRRLARELDVDLHEVEARGEDGRVRPEDVRARAEGGQTQARESDEQAAQRSKPEPRAELPDFARFGPIDRVPLRSVRRRTAERMAESWQQVARVTHEDRADITELDALRRRLAPAVERTGARLTLTAMMLKVVAAALKEHPRFNASYDAKAREVIFKRYFNIGVAVDTERGLLVPVVKDVPGSSLTELAVELQRIGEAARKGELRREQLSGGTFTLTNVGSIGGTGLTPIVNFPEVAILGMGRAALQPVVTGTLDAHETRVRLILPLSLSFDHRVIDGAEAARFVRSVIELVEDGEAFLAGT